MPDHRGAGAQVVDPGVALHGGEHPSGRPNSSAIPSASAPSSIETGSLSAMISLTVRLGYLNEGRKSMRRRP